MRRYVCLFAAAVILAATGCGGKDLPATTDPDAIKKEQERLRGEIPGNKRDPVKAEQDRLRGKGPGRP